MKTAAITISDRDPSQTTSPLRILVAIASYGAKNLKFLERIVQAYRVMPFDVHVVVLSEAPKTALETENIVGLPSKNPWTLPFAHKSVFAERLDEYDLFIYSEDDILATEANIRAFLAATEELASDEIAGFFRYEVEPSGTRRLSEAWAHYHWKAESVRQRGRFTVAEFTNEHAGFYILTQKQLRRALSSGGFLRGPCRGRYSWPETAATDPYTNCGFRKVFCITQLEEFLVHHLPNPYIAQLDVTIEAFNEQIQTLMNTQDKGHPGKTYWQVESSQLPQYWQKSYYERPSAELLSVIPENAQNILSIGCGWGLLESRLAERGADVTGFPLDSVIGATAERRGIKIVYGDFEECLSSLGGRMFDCVVMTNLLHLQPDPEGLVTRVTRLVRPGGALVLSGPNFNRFPWYVKRLLGLGDFGKMANYESSGFSLCGPGSLATVLDQSGHQISQIRWVNHAIGRGWMRGRSLPLRGATAREWIMRSDCKPVPVERRHLSVGGIR